MRDRFVQVAKATPFDNTVENGYNSTDVQQALQDLRNIQIYNPEITPTTLNGTRSLLVSNSSYQFLTGTATGYSVALPNATTLFKGRTFTIFNTTNQTVNIKDNSGSVLVVLAQNSIAYAYLQDNGTANGTWVIWQVLASSVASGIINYAVNSNTTFSTSSTTDVAITSFTITPQAGTYAVWFSCDLTIVTNNRNAIFTIYKNGSAVSDTQRTIQGVSSNYAAQSQSLGIISVNGSESIDARVRVANGSGSISVLGRTLLLIRLGT